MAARFNTGEKLVFSLALGAGAAVAVSGVLLLLPFYVTNIAEIQIVQAVVAILFVAVIITHICIGMLGMEGAFEAMATGEVDLNRAKEHHDLQATQSRATIRASGGISVLTTTSAVLASHRIFDTR